MFKITYFVGLPGPGVERRDQLELRRQVVEHFPNGATIVFGMGVWKGELEPQGTVTEVINHQAPSKAFINACKASLSQEKLLVLVERVDAKEF